METLSVATGAVMSDDIVMRYFDAWNRHDPDAIVASFDEGGTYSDPAAGTLSGPEIGAYAASLFAAFEDLSFECVTVTRHGDDVTLQWSMRGTSTGEFLGAPPTGRTFELPGIDVIVIEGGLLRSVRGFFDRQGFAEQLGFQVFPLPVAIGPFSFGYAVYACRDPRTTPGAFSITSISARSEEEAAQIDNASLDIVAELLETPGFLSWVGVTIGQRGFTITAWEDSEVPRQLTKGGPHREAMAKFFGSEWANGGFTSVWSPERINALWQRCAACDKPIDAHKAHGVCNCGAALPQPPPYF